MSVTPPITSSASSYQPTAPSINPSSPPVTGNGSPSTAQQGGDTTELVIGVSGVGVKWENLVRQSPLTIAIEESASLGVAADVSQWEPAMAACVGAVGRVADLDNRLRLVLLHFYSPRTGTLY